jgi:Lipocalin-like domain
MWLRTIFAVTVVGLTALPDHAIAQSLKERLVGTWLLVSNTNTAPDGTQRQPFGDNPNGILILEANGRYAQVFTRSGRPKFKANNRLQGTPDEMKAAWDGAVAHFGTWSVGEPDKALLLRVDVSFYPNQEGAVTADELQMLNESRAGGTTEATFRRVK